MRSSSRRSVSRPTEVAATAVQLAAGGADLVKDDELLGDPEWCRLEDRVRAVAEVLPRTVQYAANVSGPTESLLERAARAVELGAGALMINAFAQGLDGLRALRDADFGVPLFAHRVGAALWVRNESFGVAPAVIAELTRLCGADYVQVGSFTGSVYDSPAEVRAQIDACLDTNNGVNRAVAVIGGGVGPDNAEAQLDAAGATARHDAPPRLRRVRPGLPRSCGPRCPRGGRQLLVSDEALLERVPRGLGAIRHTELAIDVREVELHRLLRHP